MKEVILPKKNESNLIDLPDYVKDEMVIHFVTDISEAVRIALVSEPQAAGTGFFAEEPFLPFFQNAQPEYAPELGDLPEKIVASFRSHVFFHGLFGCLVHQFVLHGQIMSSTHFHSIS